MKLQQTILATIFVFTLLFAGGASAGGKGQRHLPLTVQAGPKFCVPHYVVRPRVVHVTPVVQSHDCGGKYRVLLKRVYLPLDIKKYGYFRDLGFRPKRSYCGYIFPSGYWVYYNGYWYVWKLC